LKEIKMDDKTRLSEKAYELAFQYEQDREHCAQCTLVAVMESLGNIDETLIQASDALTGGTVLSTNGTCGALTAGLMAISRKTGRSYQAFKNNQSDHSWDSVKKLYDRFVDKYGSPVGKRVQEKIFGRSFNLSDAEERREFVTNGAHVDKCPSVCGDVAKWTVEILLELD